MSLRVRLAAFNVYPLPPRVSGTAFQPSGPVHAAPPAIEDDANAMKIFALSVSYPGWWSRAMVALALAITAAAADVTVNITALTGLKFEPARFVVEPGAPSPNIRAGVRWGRHGWVCLR